MAGRGERIAALTCYAASFAGLLDEAGVDLLLVGDSLGMVLKGETTTLTVTLDEMAYHTACVARGARRAFVLADLPFGSYQEGPPQAYRSAARLLAAGAQMVKLEGGDWLADTVRFLTERGVPVCGHLGLLPQSVHRTGYRVQAKSEADAERLLADARALEAAGAELLVLEAIPAALAGRVTEALAAPTIGIGAGPATSGQVLVLHDAIGATPGRVPSFARNFLESQGSLRDAVAAFVRAVKAGEFPDAAHSFQ